MKPAQDYLVLALSRLKRAVPDGTIGQPRDVPQVLAALAGAEKAIAHHADCLGRVGDPVVDLDRPLLPSPGVDRHKAQLRDELAALHWETRALRKDLQAAATTHVLAPDAVCMSGTEPVQAGADSKLSDRARQLADHLAGFRLDEVHFIQESVTTDIGSGD